MRKLVTIVSLVIASASAHAGGLILNDHGASATGRADAVVATVDDGSSIFYNPAGIAHKKGVNVYFGGSLILPFASFTEESTGQVTDAERPTTVTPTFYIHGELANNLFVGIGAYAPFGSSSAWPASSPGREQSRESTLRTVFISPVLGFNLSELVPGTLTVGGGFDLVPADVDLRRDLLFGEDVGTLRLGGDGLGWGSRFGIQYAPTEDLAFGFTYRSTVGIDFGGDGDFDIDPPYRSELPPDGKIEAFIKLPRSILGGVSYRPIPQLEVEFDLNWIDWRDLETLDITLPDGEVTSIDYQWDDVFVLRLGAEYSLPHLGLDLRAGYAYDPTPVPDETLGFAPPDADRHVLSVGAGYQLPQNFFVDVGILYGIPVSNTTSDEPLRPQIKGEFDITFLVTALSIGYRFGGQPQQPAIGTGTVARK
ncbi:MAG: outer membrane protein transport protein [Deltaproteobacteria bacterium]|nr:outer membrane protein transport protein [Deltaproteobacteria bacterium]NNC75193.1 hypothetical protein [Acidimicrobiia bacterium]